MSCIRCHGFLVREEGADLYRTISDSATAFRCVNCGYIDDPLFYANRLHRRSTQSPRRNTPDALRGNGHL